MILMTTIILQTILIIGVAGTALIVFSKIPELVQFPEITEEEEIFLKTLKGRFKKVDIGKLRVSFMNRFAKFLHQIRLWSLKTDNLASKWIKKIKEESHKISSSGWIRSARLASSSQPQTENYFRKLLDSVKLGANKAEPILAGDIKEELDKEKQLIDAVVKNPRDVRSYKILGLFYYERKNYIDARESFKMALKFGCRDRAVKKLAWELEERGLDVKEV